MLLKRKISLGFVIVGFILLLSSLIAVFEFVTMKRSIEKLVKDDIAAINTSRLMMEVTDEFNYALLETMGDSSYTDMSQFPNIREDDRFINYVDNIRDNFTTERERLMADSVRYAYVAYANILEESRDLWNLEYYEKRQWYFQRLYPVYTQLRGYIKDLNSASQDALRENTEALSEGFYRSLMPCVVAVGIGIILLFLFNYFLNYYFFNPIVKINRGMKTYKNSRKVYDYSFSTGDEMEDLNENVKDLLREHKHLTKDKIQ